MAGGTAPAQVVVVHLRHIVVDEGGGMDHLQGGRHVEIRLAACPAGFQRGEKEGRTQAFASAEQAVAHGEIDGGLRRDLAHGQQAVQGPLHVAGGLSQIGLKLLLVHFCSSSPASPGCSRAEASSSRSRQERASSTPSA